MSRSRGEAICVRARTRDQPVACPSCGTETARVYGYHDRTAADVPVDGCRVLVLVRIRRILCRVRGCPVQKFRESGVLDRYQRRTSPGSRRLGADGDDLPDHRQGD